MAKKSKSKDELEEDGLLALFPKYKRDYLKGLIDELEFLEEHKKVILAMPTECDDPATERLNEEMKQEILERIDNMMASVSNPGNRVTDRLGDEAEQWLNNPLDDGPPADQAHEKDLDVRYWDKERGEYYEEDPFNIGDKEHRLYDSERDKDDKES